MSLRLFSAITSGMAQRANRLDIIMMRRRISLVVIVFVPALALAPDVAAIDTGQCVRMWTTPPLHLDIDALPCLLFVAIARRIWFRAGHRYPFVMKIS